MNFGSKQLVRPGVANPVMLGLLITLAAATFLSQQAATCAAAQPSDLEPPSSTEASNEAETPNAEIHEVPLTPSDRDHWAFQPLGHPTPPSVQDRAWPRTPVDQFILARLESDQLHPAREAGRATLIRRLYLDLVGLPPTADHVARFVADPDPAAYERLVDQLLASPRYGERWAQHWLDLARFAETDGFEHDKVRPRAWKYRDWVIQAFNGDLPYDQFARWQLAGDVLAPNNPAATIATGFCLAGPDMPDINSQVERKHTLLNEMTATVGSVFLGLQMGCAQCHDHKYDPISQADFYRLRAFFEPSVRVVANQSVQVLTAAEAEPEASHLMIRGDWQRPGPEVAPAFPRIANPKGQSITATGAGARRAALAEWLTRADHPLTARVMVNRIWQHHFGQGLSETPSDLGVMGYHPTHPRLLDWLAERFIESGWSIKSLNRLIVTSSVYRQASRLPTGEDEQAKQQWAQALEKDPYNDRLSRFPRRRLDAEVVRDCMLSVAGVLSLESGGPGVMPPLPEELKSTLLKNQWTASEREADHYRRSIYIFARRNLRYPLFEAFDRPDANASCARRGESTTAPQALLMLNSEFALEVARRVAGRVGQMAEADAVGQVEQAMLLVLGRRPTTAEQDELLDFLRQQQESLRAERRTPDQLALPLGPNATTLADPFAAAALTDLCRALLNCNEFLYVD